MTSANVICSRISVCRPSSPHWFTHTDVDDVVNRWVSHGHHDMSHHGPWRLSAWIFSRQKYKRQWLAKWRWLADQYRCRAILLLRSRCCHLHCRRTNQSGQKTTANHNFNDGNRYINFGSMDCCDVLLYRRPGGRPGIFPAAMEVFYKATGNKTTATILQAYLTFLYYSKSAQA